MIRIEVFRNVDGVSTSREFVAILEALEVSETGKRTISACVNCFADSEEEARHKALDLLQAERARNAAAEIVAETSLAKARAARRPAEAERAP